MEDGEYRVIKEIHVYDCLKGQLKMGIGVIFKITDSGRTGIVKDVLFSPSILKYCKDYYVKVKTSNT